MKHERIVTGQALNYEVISDSPLHRPERTWPSRRVKCPTPLLVNNAVLVKKDDLHGL